MKKFLLTSIGAILLLAACNNQSKKETEKTDSIEVSQPVENIPDTSTTGTLSTINLDSIPVSSAEIGTFPYFTPPAGTKIVNNPKVKTFDILLIAMPDGKLAKKEGKVFGAFIQEDKTNQESVSNALINKTYEDAILKAGGVKLFEGKLSDDQIKLYDEQATNKGTDGSLDVYNNVIKSYIIKRADGDIYIQLENTGINSGTYQIVQEIPKK